MTTEPERPDPDQLLKAIKGAEQRAERAKLKIFLGMAAGVGKTYAMLSQAQEQVTSGRDILIGVVESHGRTETEELITGLEVLPRLTRVYKDTSISEFDLDGALERKPPIILVDELAHTNAPGSRHAKRYLDVIELLDAGIEVWTTLNVQHIESLATDVERITGIRVTETVPDTILDRADDVELIDLPPAALQRRLEEGKVYSADRTHLARSNFFRTGNLTALREIALRITAERVDRQLRDYMSERGIQGPWRTRERLLVAVSPSESSEHIIRWTRRLADSLEAPWIAVFVQDRRPLTAEQEAEVTKHLRLARELGAEVQILHDTDKSAALLRTSQRENVTRIIVGRPGKHGIIETIFGTGLINKLIQFSGEIDVTIVPAQESVHRKPWRLRPASTITSYLTALASVAAVGLFGYANLAFLGYQAVAMLLLLLVAVLPLFVGRGPVILAAFLSAMVWDYFFIPPQFTLVVGKLEDLLLLSLMLLVGLTSGFLAARVKERERQISRREERAVALYSLTRSLASSTSVEQVINSAVEVLEKTFSAKCSMVEVGTDGRLVVSWSSEDEREHAVAQWVAEHRTVAGRFTDTLVSIKSTIYPLIIHDRCVGVISMHTSSGKRLTIDQEGLLQSSLQQIAGAIERERLRRSAERSRMMEESERLYSTLLNSISHELRTPLATIKSAAGLLREGDNLDQPQLRKILSDEIVLSSERLNRLVSNLLDMSRLEADRIVLQRQMTDPRDIVSAAIDDLTRELEKRSVNIEIDENLPLINIDGILIEQCLVNLLNNAILYSDSSTPIDVKCKRFDGHIAYSVRDHGKGIPLESIDKVFDKFYRAPGTRSGGTGLGLSIAKGFVEAHDGTISVHNTEDGGAEFVILLPIEDSTNDIGRG